MLTSSLNVQSSGIITTQIKRLRLPSPHHVAPSKPQILNTLSSRVGLMPTQV